MDKLLSSNFQHTDCLIACSTLLLSTPHSFPRYFYQSLQTTNIKVVICRSNIPSTKTLFFFHILSIQLAISPSQRGSNDRVVEINQRLALKVEGVVQHTSATSQDDDVNANARNGERKGGRVKFREVSRVRLAVAKSKQGQTKVNNAKVLLIFQRVLLSLFT